MPKSAYSRVQPAQANRLVCCALCSPICLEKTLKNSLMTGSISLQRRRKLLLSNKRHRKKREFIVRSRVKIWSWSRGNYKRGSFALLTIRMRKKSGNSSLKLLNLLKQSQNWSRLFSAQGRTAKCPNWSTSSKSVQNTQTAFKSFAWHRGRASVSTKNSKISTTSTTSAKNCKRPQSVSIEMTSLCRCWMTQFWLNLWISRS